MLPDSVALWFFDLKRNHSLKYLRFMSFGCKYKKIIKSEFVAKTQSLWFYLVSRIKWRCVPHNPVTAVSFNFSRVSVIKSKTNWVHIRNKSLWIYVMKQWLGLLVCLSYWVRHWNFVATKFFLNTINHMSNI